MTTSRDHLALVLDIDELDAARTLAQSLAADDHERAIPAFNLFFNQLNPL